MLAQLANILRTARTASLGSDDVTVIVSTNAVIIARQAKPDDQV